MNYARKILLKELKLEKDDLLGSIQAGARNHREQLESLERVIQLQEAADLLGEKEIKPENRLP